MARNYRNVTDRDLGLKALMRELDNARLVEVAIGIHEGSKNQDATIAEYAFANEYGTEKIPSRPFMRTSFDENVGKIQNDMEQQAGRVLTGISTIHQALSVIGMKQQDRTKRTISDRNFLPKNAPMTIAKKKSQHTLIDTGAMLASVHYVVRPKS